MNDLKHTFDQYCHDLDTKAQQLRQGTQIVKASGIASAAIGAFGLIGTGLAVVPLAIGLGTYGYALLRENSTTGRLQPLPWSQESGASMAAGAIQHQHEEVGFRLTDYDHLSLEEKADYTLFSIMGPVIIPLIQDATPIQQERFLTNARRTIVKYHSDILVDPEPMASTLYGSLSAARGAFAKNLPEDMQQKIQPEILAAATQRRDLSIEATPTLEAQQITPVRPSESQVGAETRLDAIEVPAVNVPAIATPAATPEQTQESMDTANAMYQFFTARSMNLLIVASGGSGKGYTLANIARWRSQANPKAITVWFDPKNDPDETGYFDHPSIRPYRFKASDLKPAEVAKKVRGLITYYRELCASMPAKTPIWLVFDEWTTTINLLKNEQDLTDEIIGLIISAISLKDADNQHIALVGQSPNVNDVLPGKGGVAANLKPFMLTDNSGYKLLNKMGQAGHIDPKTVNPEALTAACDESPVGRAVVFNDRMWPAPKLPNYSSFDRDTQQYIGKPPVIKNYAETVKTELSSSSSFDPTSVISNAPVQPIPAVTEDTHTAVEVESVLGDHIGVNLQPSVQPNREELGDSGLTSEEACNSIAKFMHKIPGKARGSKTILSQVFGTKKQEALKLFIKALMKKVAQDHPDCFTVTRTDNDLQITCKECLLSEQAYYAVK